MTSNRLRRLAVAVLLVGFAAGCESSPTTASDPPAAQPKSSPVPPGVKKGVPPGGTKME